MIAARRLQRSFADGLIAEEVQDLWEPWMRHADAALNDDQLLGIVQQELSKRIKKSKTRGRTATSAEVVLRMLLLKHLRAWSYEELAREVRANLVYREFTGVGGGKVPDDKTMGRLARQLGPEAIEKLPQRIVAIAVEQNVITGRKLRVDTTVVETNIHYPTDSTLMSDGVRVLTRVMKRVAAVAGEAGAKFRDRSRSVKRQTSGRDQSSSGTGQKVLWRDGGQRQQESTGEITESQTAARRNDSAGTTGHAADAAACAGWQHTGEEQNCQRVRTAD
jgi:transposase, IS5 family